MKHRLNILMVLALAAGTGTGAPPEPALTVDQLVAEALEANPERRYYLAEMEAAQGDLTQAGTRANPQLSLQAGYLGVRPNGGNGLSNGPSWSAAALQPFEWPGRMALRKAIANRQLDLARLGLAEFEKRLAASVRNHAQQIWIGQRLQAIAREGVDRAEALRQVLVRRDPAGVTPLLDLRVIEAGILIQRDHLLELELGLSRDQLELNRLRGRPPQTPLTLAASEVALPPAPDLATLWDAVWTNNFSLKAQRLEIEQQGFRVDLARNERKPTISVGPYVTRDTAYDEETSAGIQISLPLPLWNRKKGEIKTSEARLSQAEATMEVARRNLETELLQAYSAYRARLEAQAQWRPDALETLRQATELGDRHYRLGALPVSTYLELQTRYFEAAEVLLRNQAEALKVRQDLEWITGWPASQWPAQEGGRP